RPDLAGDVPALVPPDVEEFAELPGLGLHRGPLDQRTKRSVGGKGGAGSVTQHFSTASPELTALWVQMMRTIPAAGARSVSATSPKTSQISPTAWPSLSVSPIPTD